MSDFAPVNALERMLLATQEGRAQPSALFGALHSSRVMVLLDRPLGADGRWNDATAMLVLNNAAGEPLVAMFTAPERAEGWPEKSPAHGHGALVDFRWLLGKLSPQVGVVLNPGSKVGVEMSAALLAKLREANRTLQ